MLLFFLCDIKYTINNDKQRLLAFGIPLRDIHVIYLFDVYEGGIILNINLRWPETRVETGHLQFLKVNGTDQC